MIPSLSELLPASAPELAARWGVTARQANARLCYWARRGWVRRVGRSVPYAAARGLQYAQLWDATVAGRDVRPVGAASVWWHLQWVYFFKAYQVLRARCAAAQWRERHAYTHMGLVEIKKRRVA